MNRIRPVLILFLLAAAALALWRWLRRPALVQSMETRVAWTGSTITGSPDPPPPYQTERIFPRLSFNAPTDLAYAPGSRRLFVVEQGGKVYSVPDDADCRKADLFIDLAGEVRTVGRTPEAKGVGNAYGIAFHPQFEQNHYVYICYVLDSKAWGKNLPTGSRVSRFTVRPGDPPRVDPASEVILLEWEAGGHNGGCLKFGHDGCLYISAGDQGDPNPPDPFNTGQDITDLRSSILRIDVDHPSQDKPYSIPKDNPFVSQPGARGEVYAYGLRNPWRFSVDRQTGRIWVADVGWELWETVHCIEPGGNYGWSIMEGPQVVHPEGKRGPTPIIPPLAALPHTESASITGGIVYRGKKLPELAGHYVFGDWETRRLWAAKVVDERKLEPYREIAQTDQRIVSFTEDPDGELVVLNYEGTLHRVVPNPAKASGAFPRTLSATGLFESVRDQKPAAGVYGFSPKVEQWVDGAIGRRFVAVPTTRPVTLAEDGKRVWPADSVLVRTLSLGSRNVETQVLHFDGKQWKGYTYAWNDQGSDAQLVEAGGAQREVSYTEGAATKKRTWHYPSRAQCSTCHNPWTEFTLAFTEAQLDKEVAAGGVAGNQLQTFRKLGLIPSPPAGKPGETPPPSLTLADPNDASASVETRARSYLHVNCSHCHRMGGGGSAMIDLRADLPLNRSFAMDAPAQLGTFGIEGAKVICPGDPGRSILLYRLSKAGRGHMPKIGSTLVDDRGVALLAQWIEQLPQRGATPRSRMEEMAAAASLQSGSADPAAREKALKTPSGALTVAASLAQGQWPTSARQQIVELGAASPDENIRDLFERFLPEERQVQRLGNDIQPAMLLALPGQAEAGRKVFFELGGGLCARCHRAGDRGEDFGPDLTHIATRYTREQILENILLPSKTIEEKYRVWTIRTSKGEDFAGFIVEENASEVVLKDAQKQLIHVKKGDIKKRTRQEISAMPEGILGDLTAQQAADLLAFLSGLK